MNCRRNDVGLLLVLCLLSAQTTSGADDTAEIVVTECRIKLIDHVILASERPGVLAVMAHREGDRVTGGERIAGLKDDVARAAAAITEKKSGNDVRVRFARKATEVADAEYVKALEANRQARGAIPEIEIQRLKLASEQSRLEIEQAEYEFEISGLENVHALAELKTYEVVAPFEGIVTRVFKQKGEAVQQGDPIVELSGTDRVRVEGYLDVADAARVGRGNPVKVQLETTGKTPVGNAPVFDGMIVFVDVSVDPVTGRRVRAWAEVDNSSGLLRAGLRARMVVMPGTLESLKDR